MSKINIVQCPSEIGAGTRGASLGPQALQINAAEQNFSLYSNNDVLKIPVEEVKTYHANSASLSYNKELLDLYYNIYRHFSPLVNKYDQHLIFTGDHSSAGGFFGTMKDQMPNYKWGLLWIDAHGDLHTPYTTPSGNYHGMPVANILGLNNTANAVRELDKQTHDNWIAMQYLGDRQLCPKLDADGVFLMDIRDLEQEEWDLINHYNIAYTTPEQRKRNGIHDLRHQAIEFAGQFDALYVSFDIDSLDAELVPGTGTPVVNGLSWREAETLLEAVCKLQQTKVLEITEINPLKDQANQVAHNMNQVLQNVLVR